MIESSEMPSADSEQRSRRTSRAGAVLLLLPMAVIPGLGVLVPDRADWGALVLAAALWGLAAWGLFRLTLFALRGRWRELLLATGALAMALLIGEGALRLLRPYESLPRFRWIASRRYHHLNPPDRTMFSGYVGRVPILIKTNEDGLRTPHSRAEFLRHRVRIAVLGDSFVFGSGVDGESTFPARLEKRLRDRPGAADVAVLNAGVISYSPLLEKRLFDGLLHEYRPTLVLLFLDVTDIGDDSIYAGKASGGEPEPFPLEGESRLQYYGALHQLLQPYLARLAAQVFYPAGLIRAALGRPQPSAASSNYYLNHVVFEGHPENRYFIYRHPLARTRPYFSATFSHVEAIAASAASVGARFVLVVVPRYHHWSQQECPENWELRAYRTDEPFQYEYFRFFDEKRGTAGFPVYDLLTAFRQAGEFPLVFPNDPHWNPKGHDFVARTMLEYLSGAALVPSPSPGS